MTSYPTPQPQPKRDGNPLKLIAFIVGGLLLAACAVLIVWALVNQLSSGGDAQPAADSHGSHESHDDGGTSAEPAQSEAPAETDGTSAPGESTDAAPVMESSGMVSVMDASGQMKEVPFEFSSTGILVGDPSATVVDYYFDFSCPHCEDYHKMTGTEYADLIASGKLTVRYHIVSFVSEYSPLAANAAFATAALQPEKFEQVHEVLMLNTQKASITTDADVAELLKKANLGLNPEVLQAIETGTYRDLADDQTMQATEAGLQGVPSAAVNGKFVTEMPTDRASIESTFGLK